MTVDFKYAIGQKVCYRVEADSGILKFDTVIAATIYKADEENIIYYRTEKGWNPSQSEIASELEAFDLATKYHQYRIDSIKETKEAMWNNSQSDEGWKKDRVPEEH